MLLSLDSNNPNEYSMDLLMKINNFVTPKFTWTHLMQNNIDNLKKIQNDHDLKDQDKKAFLMNFEYYLTEARVTITSLTKPKLLQALFEKDITLSDFKTVISSSR